MALSETEELELLTLERERAMAAQAPKPKTQAGPKEIPQAAKDDALARVAAEEENPNLVAVGRALSRPIEGIQQAISNIVPATSDTDRENRKKLNEEAAFNARAEKAMSEQHPLTRVVGAGTDVALGAVLPAVKAAQGAGGIARTGAGATTGAIYAGTQPTSGEGSFAKEKAAQVASGAATGGALTGALEAATRGPSFLRSIVDRFKAKPAAAPAPTAKASDTTTELQRQREVMSGREKAKAQGGSEYERMSTDFEERMRPVREAAFSLPDRVGAGDTLSAIQQFEKVNPDAKVRAALKEVRQTVERAVAGSRAAAPQGARMTAAQYRQMQQGANADDMNVAMADEVRQSINRMIERKGDNALDGHTKDVLAQVRDRLVGGTPQGYKDYLEQYRSGVSELDRFDPQRNVIGKVTADDRAAPALQGQDAQMRLEAIFSGKTPTKDLQELMAATAHDPKANAGLRQSFVEWLKPTNQVGKVDAGAAVNRWNDVKDAVRDARMFAPDHYAAIDSVMTKLHGSDKGAEAAKQTAAAVAWAAGLPFGRPGSAAMAARTAVGRMTGGEKTTEQIDAMVTKIMNEPRAAAAAAAPATPENIRRLEEILSISVPMERNKPQPRKENLTRPNPLGMRPGGL